MTRETKAGLVVSCSFLCLVGLVFYSKLNGHGSYSAEANAEDALIQAPDAPVAVAEIQSDSQTTILPPSAESPNNSASESASLVSTPLKSEKSEIGDTSTGEHDNQPNHEDNNSKVSKNFQSPSYQMPEEEDGHRNHDAASPSPAEVSSSESSSKNNDSEDAGNGVNLHPIQEDKEKKDVSKASLSLTVEEQLKQAVKNAAAISAESEKSKKNASEESGFRPPTSETPTRPDPNDATEKAANSNLKLEPPPTPSHYKEADPLRTLPEDPPKGSANISSPAVPAPGKPIRDPGIKKSIAAPTEASGIKLQVPEMAQGTGSTRSGGQIQGLTPGVMPSPLLTPPPAGDTAPEPHVQLGRPTPVPSPSKQFPQGPSERQPNPPGGLAVTAAPLTGTAGPVAGKPDTVPRVESYDEETYICQAGDTFPGISTHYYYTDKYALPLLQFNRHHPRAAVGIGQDPPVLQAGQPVYIPPLRILEKQYLSASGETTGITQVAAPAPVAADPRNQAAFPVPAVTFPPGKTTPSGERTYLVPERGEMFLEIARKTLGSPDRWGEIYRLNPRFDPKYPVPAGTNLRLPPDARLAVPEKPPMPQTPQPKVENGTPDPSR